MHGRLFSFLIGPLVSILAITLTGCLGDSALDNRKEKETAVQTGLATEYDSAATGTIRGQVRWQGKRPGVPEFAVTTSLLFHPPWPPTVLQNRFANPNAPVINPSGDGVVNAVVFLKNVDLKRAKPWDQPPVQAAFDNYQIRIEQGKQEFQTGFVRAGSDVKLLSAEQRFHIMRADGASFFALALPAANQPRRRRLTQKGIVELSSGAHYYWLRAWLFVDEHPYYVRCDAKGRFTLDGVPAGNYEIAAWMPNWIVDHYDREPEHRHISRLYYRSPVERSKNVRVQPGKESAVEFAFSEAMFAK